MIQAIVYDNKAGYRFYERSEGFPKNAEEEILGCCELMADPVTEGVAYRYQPISAGRSILSVVFRRVEQPGRGYNQIVTFLMDSDAADHLMSLPYESIKAWSADLADDILRNPSCIRKDYTDNMPETEEAWARIQDTQSKTPCWIQNEIGLIGAVLAGHGPDMKEQLFVGTEDVEPILRRMITALPTHLRVKISFCDGIRSGSESKGAEVVFARPEVLRTIVENGYNGGSGKTRKYYFISEDEKKIDEKLMKSISNFEKVRREFLKAGSIWKLVEESVSSMEQLVAAADKCRQNDLSPMIDLVRSEILEAAVADGEVVEDSLRTLYARSAGSKVLRQHFEAENEVKKPGAGRDRKQTSTGRTGAASLGRNPHFLKNPERANRDTKNSGRYEDRGKHRDLRFPAALAAVSFVGLTSLGWMLYRMKPLVETMDAFPNSMRGLLIPGFLALTLLLVLAVGGGSYIIHLQKEIMKEQRRQSEMMEEILRHLEGKKN